MRRVFGDVVAGLLAFCASTSAGAGAWGQDPAPGYALDYAAPPECPARGDFVAAVAARSRGAREVRPENARLLIDVAIAVHGSGATGSLRLRLPDGRQSRREIPEASCSEVLSSMAVIAAMVLDAGRLEMSPEVSEPAPPSEAQTAPPAGDGTSSKALRSPMAASERSNAKSCDTAASTTAVPEGSRPWAHGLVQGGVATAVGPDLAGSAGAGFELALGPALPSVRALAVWARAPRVSTPAGSADFQQFAGRIAICLPRWPASTTPTLALCGTAEVGELLGTSDDAYLSRAQRMLWLGVGATLRVEATISSWMTLELEAGVKGLVRHDRFMFEPTVVVYDVPPVAVAFSLGAALGGR